ncbi:MAG TPA: OmpH family outer membrane protein [Chitinophagaceae bacterium]|nr:OmpH family outer membrane protein [Chitinophagaceae bacterium]
MKKLFTVMVVIAGLLCASSAGAQTKIGYISVDNMVGLMPDVNKIDSLLNRYQIDSLNPEYASLLSRYQFKDSVWRDSTHTPPAVRKEIEKELPTMLYQLNNWDKIVDQLTQNKQNEYLEPIYKKVYDAIKAVAKEKGYTHVFNKEAFLVAPEGDDMIAAVAAKLKVKLPPPNTGR